MTHRRLSERARTRRRGGRFLVTSYLLLFTWLGGALAADLKSPVDVTAQREAFRGATIEALKCPLPALLPTALTEIGFYTNPPFYSKVDPEKVKEFYAAMAPLRDAEETIAHALSNFVRADSNSAPPYGDCILAQLDKFVADDAMATTTDFQGLNEVKLSATTPIFAYVVLRDSYPIPTGKRQQIEDWIRRVATIVLAQESKFALRDWKPYPPNNIDDWAAAVLAVSSVALQDRTFLDAALRLVDRHAATITDDGMLPSEMARGERALLYSLFATQAISVVMSVAEANNIEAVRHYSNGAVLRLMHAMARAVVEPSTFVTLSHDSATVSSNYVHAQDLAWLALARRYSSNSDVVVAYCSLRPLYGFREGGEWETFFGSPNVCLHAHSDSDSFPISTKMRD